MKILNFHLLHPKAWVSIHRSYLKVDNVSEQMAVAARNAEGYGWLCPALGVMELSQNIIQVGWESRSIM